MGSISLGGASVIRVSLALLVSCATTEPTPRVRIAVVDAYGYAEPLPEYLEGARAWEPLGFEVTFGARGVESECPRRWYDGADVDCQITIELVRKPRLVETDGTLALSDIARRGIAIDPRVTDRDALLTAVAHEVGHILLDTSMHTTGGIMGGQGWQMFAPWPDLQLACMTIGRCVDGDDL